MAGRPNSAPPPELAVAAKDAAEGATAERLVLVTSRRSLADLPTAVPLGLDVLSPDEAVTMFLRRAPRAAPTATRWLS